MGVVATMVKTRLTIKYKEDWLWLMVSALSISVLANVLITTSLSYILWRERRDSLKRYAEFLNEQINIDFYAQPEPGELLTISLCGQSTGLLPTSVIFRIVLDMD
ncbi:hypothetical protein H0H93_002658 [Arthromyces matolae]|nr:hypothetical protein H0H93_002658 [Arthromyces matolae]